jgi:hypothetical protein
MFNIRTIRHQDYDNDGAAAGADASISDVEMLLSLLLMDALLLRNFAIDLARCTARLYSLACNFCNRFAANFSRFSLAECTIGYIPNINSQTCCYKEEED